DLAFRQSPPAAFPFAPSQWWAAGGIKYYLAFPSAFMNFAIQYERVNNTDAPGGEQRGTNNITFQMQTLLFYRVEVQRSARGYGRACLAGLAAAGEPTPSFSRTGTTATDLASWAG